jgi:ADP-ribosylglycohydrolase
MLHGIALGDALGAPVEKLSAAEIAARYGRVEGLDTEWHKMALPDSARNGRVRGGGIVTDDTLMSLCLIEVYAEERRHLDAWDMAGGMVRAIAWRPRWVPELQREAALIERLFYPEKWIFQRHQLASCDPRQGGIGNMVNCGAAMYIAPVGAVNACDPQAAYDEAIAFASGHQESYGLEAAGGFAAAVAAAFTPDANIDSVVEAVLAVTKDGTRAAVARIAEEAWRMRGKSHAAVTEAFHRAIRDFSPMGDDVERRPETAGQATAAYRPSRLGSIEELPLALGYALVNAGHFRASVLDGINSGRDTDSIGVMAGAVLGALHGEGVIDAADAETLDRVNRLDLRASADEFTDIITEIHAADAARRDAVASGRSELGT